MKFQTKISYQNTDKYVSFTLYGFAEPKDLATTSWIPTTSQTDLIAPPAIIPVPAGADLKKTFTEPCNGRPNKIPRF